MAITLQTQDVDTARETISKVFCPHQLHPTRLGVKVRLQVRQHGPVTLVGLDHGHRVRIQPGELNSFYLVQIPLAGQAHIHHGSDQVMSTSRVAAVLSPTDPVDMVWGERNPQLLCRVDRGALDAELAALTGECDLAPVRFRAAMSLEQPGVRQWVQNLRALWQSGTGTVRQQQAVLTGLLLTQPHNHTDLVRRGGGRSATVRRARAYMEARIAEALPMSRVASELGIGVRELQKAFRLELDTTPLSWLKVRRLELAYDNLLAGDPATTTVTAVATSVGIGHLGRFSLEYRAHFDEHPSQTLGRRTAI